MKNLENLNEELNNQKTLLKSLEDTYNSAVSSIAYSDLSINNRLMRISASAMHQYTLANYGINNSYISNLLMEIDRTKRRIKKLEAKIAKLTGREVATQLGDEE